MLLKIVFVTNCVSCFTAHPMSLCFLLLRSQFHHFSINSGSSGGASIATATPTTPGGSQQLIAWRNPTQVDKVACQLILRCILHLHHTLAVHINANRECAQAFAGISERTYFGGILRYKPRLSSTF